MGCEIDGSTTGPAMETGRTRHGFRTTSAQGVGYGFRTAGSGVVSQPIGTLCFITMKEEEMRKVLLSILLALTVVGFTLPSISSPAHADCSNGDTYDSHGSRCR